MLGGHSSGSPAGGLQRGDEPAPDEVAAALIDSDRATSRDLLVLKEQRRHLVRDANQIAPWQKSNRQMVQENDPVDAWSMWNEEVHSPHRLERRVEHLA